MSLENAILELASAMRENTAALDKHTKAVSSVEFTTGEIVTLGDAFGGTEVLKRETDAVIEGMTDSPAPAGEETAATIEQGDPEVEEAVAQIEAAALVYKTDVLPVLLKVHKKSGREELVKLLAKYNVKNGDQLTADDLPKILADANKIIGG